MDRISNLPDEIIFHIGSFLSAKEVAFTTVLSKRWHILSSIIHGHLHFDASGEEDIKDFMDGVLSLPSTTRVRKFSLQWCSEDDIESVQYDRINGCLREVLKRGLFELDLWINDQEGKYSLPFEVFTCKTLTKLSLGSGFAIESFPQNVLLPSLKTLFLYSIRFYEFGRCAFKTLLDACPILEELTMRGINWEHWKWSRTVSSLSLKRLIITRKGWDDFDDSDFKSISIDTPGLVYLKYFDYLPKEYGNVNLSSLVEAELYLLPEENYMWEECDVKRFRPVNFLNGLKNVVTLNLYTIQTAKVKCVLYC